MVRTILRTGEAETGRVEAFSDGVLAIVITLLVLDVKIPEHVQGGNSELWHALAAQLPMIGAWAISFFFVLVFWMTHHYFFRQLAHVDRGLLWLNGLFLFAISFTPVPTALLGLYPDLSASATMLSAAMFLTASSFSLMRWYATTNRIGFAVQLALLRYPGIALAQTHEDRLRQFVREGHASDAHQLGRYATRRRRAILATTVLDLEMRLTDAVLDMADKLVAGRFQAAPDRTNTMRWDGPAPCDALDASDCFSRPWRSIGPSWRSADSSG